MKQTTFSNRENTRIYQNHFGWTGETHTKVNGKNWVITTMKRHNGIIATNCKVVQDEGGGSFSYMMFDNNPKENFWLNELPRGTKATEKNIKEAHYKALALFDEKNEVGELPKEEYKIEVGQILFTHGFIEDNPRAIYKIDGNHFHTVFLDATDFKIDSHIRPWSKKFGIGTYYKEGDKISEENLNNLLIEATQNKKIQDAINAEKSREAAIKAEEKKKYLSQFKEADRRTTTNIIKRHIYATWPEVSKVEIFTEVFSGGDSMNVKYYSPQPVKALESFISNFKEGSFDSMTDYYNYDTDKEEIILEGHILQTYKYCFCKHIEAAPAPELTIKQQPVITMDEVKETVINSVYELVDYSEKALAVFGNTKPIKEQLKAIGGRFNAFLKKDGQTVPGWVFSKNKAAELRNLLGL